MSPVEQSKALVTAHLLDDEEAMAMLVSESDDPLTVRALTALSCALIRQTAHRTGMEPDELWRRTLRSYAAAEVHD